MHNYKSGIASIEPVAKYMDIVLLHERLSDGSPVYVAHCTTLDISSQGTSIEEAKRNITEAVHAYLEERPELLDEVDASVPPTFSFIEVPDGKAARPLGR